MTNVEKLESVGIEVDPYKRGPISKNAFVVALSGSKLRIWEGSANVTVSTNKRKRQAVITVLEPSRIIKTYAIMDVGSSKTKEEAEVYIHDNYLINAIQKNARVQVPGARCKITNYSDFSKSEYGWSDIRVDIDLSTKSTHTSFLVGYDKDGQKPFVCQLKDVVSTVDEAHRSLLPTNVALKKGYKRQGEWFFNPVSEQIQKELFNSIHKARCQPIDGKTHIHWFLERTSHQGLCIKQGSKNYAIGVIKDRRPGRHKPLLLDKWYEVIRNNEVQVNNTRSTTWD